MMVGVKTTELGYISSQAPLVPTSVLRFAFALLRLWFTDLLQLYTCMCPAHTPPELLTNKHTFIQKNTPEVDFTLKERPLNHHILNNKG